MCVYLSVRNLTCPPVELAEMIKGRPMLTRQAVRDNGYILPICKPNAKRQRGRELIPTRAVGTGSRMFHK